MSEEEFNKIFAKRLNYFLNKYSMSQLDLSKKLKVGPTSVSNWCRGIKSPRMDKVDAMCKVFRCSRSDVDIDARLIHVTKTYDMVNCELTHSTKTETSTRDVRIRPELMPVILDINKMMTKRHIVCSHFITDSTDYLSYDSFRQYLGDKTLQVVGRRLTPHALRHTFVSLAAASGLPLDVITRQVGHASEEITQIYLHATEMMKEKDNARLDAVSFL